MSLDMTLYKVEKLSDSEIKNITNKDIDSLDDTLFVFSELPDDLQDKLVKVPLLVHKVNKEKFLTDYPGSICPFIMTENHIVMLHAKIDDDTTDYTIPTEKYNSYFEPCHEDCFVGKFTEIWRWRNNYNLSNALCNAYASDGGICENMKYHKLNQDMYDILYDYIGDGNPEDYFYYEWY